MNKIKILLMRRKPSLNEFAQPEMSKKAKTVFYASFEDARKEQDRLLRKAKSLTNKS